MALVLNADSSHYREELEMPGGFRDIHEIRAANKAKGFHYFDADATRFFRSRIASGTYGGRLFIDSTQYVSSDGSYVAARQYRVKVMSDDTTVSDAAGWDSDQMGYSSWGYATLTAARKYASELATRATMGDVLIGMDGRELGMTNIT